MSDYLFETDINCSKCRTVVTSSLKKLDAMIVTTYKSKGMMTLLYIKTERLKGWEVIIIIEKNGHKAKIMNS